MNSLEYVLVFKDLISRISIRESMSKQLSSKTPYALELRGVSKFFPGVIANEKVNLTLRQGEIHTLLGENGAGKSTLMNVVTGLYPADEGSIFVSGEKVHFSNPRQAIERGIGMVHQHFMLVANHTVAENIIMGTPQPFHLNFKKINQEIKALSAKYGLAVVPEKKVGQLSVGEQQRVEILKVLYRGAKILILDEPTAVLTPKESEALYEVIFKMVKDGHSVIFISHKMKEVKYLSDRITILSKGKAIRTFTKEEAQKQDLSKAMMSSSGAASKVPVTVQADSAPQASSSIKLGDKVIQLRGINAFDKRGTQVLDQVDLDIRSGEIIGLAGVSGNGQTPLAEVLSGMQLPSAGKYEFCGAPVIHHNVENLIKQGLGYIPEDRKKFGIAKGLSIADNFLLRDHDNPNFYIKSLLSGRKVLSYARDKMKRFDIRAASEKTQIGKLSGGNIQKAILSREISRSLKFLLACQPIRGLDVNASNEIQQQIIKAKEGGLAVLLISEDLDELMLMSDKIYVICGGRMVGSLTRKEATIEKIGNMMTGIAN